MTTSTRGSSHHDVIVIGARAAGASTAMLLARRGWRVLVLERSSRGADTVCTHAVIKTGVYQLRRWGLLDRVLAAGTPPVLQTTIHYGDESVVIPATPTTDIPFLLAPRRTVLDPVLVDAAVEAGTDVRFDTSVARPVFDAGRLVGVTGRDADDIPFEARAELVIGADGRRSTLARLVGAEDRLRMTNASAVAYTYFGAADPSDDDFGGYEWCCRPDALAGVTPTSGGVLAWVAVASDRFRSRIRPDVAAGFWEVLRSANAEMHDRLAARTRTSRFHVFTGAHGFVRRAHGPGWTLVGDASHATDPISSHGISDALRDAELLAHHVDAGLREPSTMAAELARYEHQRDALALPILPKVDRLASFRWTMDEVRQHLREVNAATQDDLRVLRTYADREGARAA
jgi:2-polyprenyl-6-methoxyphenol hydroxylase-like FAD-dependent oxidoreductase